MQWELDVFSKLVSRFSSHFNIVPNSCSKFSPLFLHHYYLIFTVSTEHQNIHWSSNNESNDKNRQKLEI